MHPLIGGALIGVGGSFASNAFNFGLTERQNDLNVGLMREAWAREDNAVRRRVDDMRAAGINPLLAAGNPAQASAPVSVGKSNVDTGQILAGAMAGAQIDHMRHQNELLDRQVEIAELEAANLEQDNWRKWYDNVLTRAFGATERQAGIEQAATDIATSRNNLSYLLATLDGRITRYGLENTIMRQEQALNSIGIARRDLDLMMKEIEQEYQRRGLEIDIADKRVRAEIQEVALEIAKHDSSVVVNSGFTSSAHGSNRFVQLGTAIARALIHRKTGEWR